MSTQQLNGQYRENFKNLPNHNGLRSGKGLENRENLQNLKNLERRENWKNLKVLIVGSGGREHVLAWKCLQSPLVDEVYCAPGNPGMGAAVTRVDIAVDDVQGMVKFAGENQIDLTVVGPEAPLLDGIVDAFAAAGLQAYGPSAKAARMEGSKSEAKAFMERWSIPTAGYQVCYSVAEAEAFIDEHGAPIVVKVDGLASGKGVVVAMTVAEAKAAVSDFHVPGSCIILEEYMEGEEVSLLAFVDGETVVPMAFAQDHKPVFDGDRGPNTGGMGAYSPVPQFGSDVMETALEQIVRPTAAGLVAEGTPFRGILYTGLMITDEGPKVVEYNVRFGDPEAQALLPRLKTDLVEILLASMAGRLAEMDVQWKQQAAATVVAASAGYPGDYPCRVPIQGDVVSQRYSSMVFHAGTDLDGKQFVTNGGRVLAVTGLGDSLDEALKAAYARLGNVHFAGMHYRKDIGQKALQAVGC